jgi:Predicted transcriptional regulators
MGYSIAEVAEKTSLTPHTLRYYEKEGLLPFVDRSDTGNRDFKEKDLEWLELICCLKNTGMSIKQIKEVIALCLKGDDTLEIRREIFIRHREEVLNQITELHKNLDKINCKINYYDSICNRNSN